MWCLAGTDEGVRRCNLAGSESRLLLAADRIYSLARDHEGRLVAGGEGGLKRSADGGDTWDGLGLSEYSVHAVSAVPDTDRLLAGTSPPQIFWSDDGGSTWTRSSNFGNLPERETWQWGGDPTGGLDAVRVVSVDAHRAEPDRVYAAVESVGVVRSEDGGQTWQRADRGLVADPHDLTLRSPDDVIAATGDGLYRTTDAGRTWFRLDTARELFWFSYAAAATVHDGALYTAVEDRAEYRSDADVGARSLLLRSTDGGGTFERSRAPGATRTAELTGTVQSFVRAFTVVDGHVLGVTRGGRLIRRGTDGTWSDVGDVGSATYALLAD